MKNVNVRMSLRRLSGRRRLDFRIIGSHSSKKTVYICTRLKSRKMISKTADAALVALFVKISSAPNKKAITIESE